MVTVADLGVYTASLFGLMVFIASILKYELNMGTFIASLTSMSVTSAGLMVALALRVSLEVPFVWSTGTLAAVTLLFVGLYEIFSRFY
jgi:hypothetical protein